MADAANECIPYYEPGTRITGHCKAAVSGKRFVKIAASIQSGPGLSATAEGGNIQVEHQGAKGYAFGVTSHDGAIKEKVTILRGPMVVPVKAGEAMSAGEEVGVGANGVAVKKGAEHVAAGRLLADVAENADAMVALYV